jgi:predicted transcriptional regulator
MNDFQRGYILAYFKDHQQDYSFYALANSLGISVSVIDDLICELIEENQLVYNSDNMLVLTPRGRLTILNEQVDFLSFDDSLAERRIIKPKTAISLDQIYIPDDFISKLK